MLMAKYDKNYKNDKADRNKDGTKSGLLDRYTKETEYKVIISILLAIIIVFLFIFIWNYFSALLDNKSAISTCGDGSFYNTCDLNKPYYCDANTGLLVENATLCGCPDDMYKSGDSCYSLYQTGAKEISLKYVLRGEEQYLNFTVYKGLADYLSDLPKTINYQPEEKPLRSDFKLRNINNNEQRQLLLPLLIAIQNTAENKEDQIRIAISIVQNIEFGESGESQNLPGNNSIIHSRYPYEVLYDGKGICEEKSELLAFLLKETGYGVVFFYYQDENHEALGIKCPARYSIDNTGYCFIETTGPSIMTDSEIEYAGGIKLISEPEIILVSNGEGLGYKMYEYADAKEMIKLRNGGFVLFRESKMNNLREKYGLINEYPIG